MTVYEVRDYDPLPLHMQDWFHFGQQTTDGAAFFSRGGGRAGAAVRYPGRR